MTCPAVDIDVVVFGGLVLVLLGNKSVLVERKNKKQKQKNSILEELSIKSIRCAMPGCRQRKEGSSLCVAIWSSLYYRRPPSTSLPGHDRCAFNSYWVSRIAASIASWNCWSAKLTRRRQVKGEVSVFFFFFFCSWHRRQQSWTLCFFVEYLNASRSILPSVFKNQTIANYAPDFFSFLLLCSEHNGTNEEEKENERWRRSNSSHPLWEPIKQHALYGVRSSKKILD